MPGGVRVGRPNRIKHIPLSWDVTKARSNHEPKFRPVGDAVLRGRERSVGQVMEEMFAAMPPVEPIIAGEMDVAAYLAGAMEVAEPYRVRIAEILQPTFNEGALLGQDRIRADMNEQLRRLRSPLRLTDADGDVTKATANPQTVGGVRVGMSPKAEWAAIGIEAFDSVDAASVQYAQFRSGTLVTAMVEEQQRVIQNVIGESFTAQQTFQTGRTVTGLTAQQTSQALVTVLQDVNPTTSVGQNLARFRSVNLNGLTQPWEQAVYHRAERMADALAKQGVTGVKAQMKIQKSAQAHANKLRRSRARMISRTEIKRAQVQGQLSAMRQAVSDGLADPRTAGKKWVTGATDVCPVCTDLGFGKAIPLDQSFEGVGDGPPAHPNCRCDLDFSHTISEAPKAIGAGDPKFPAGTPENPIVWQFPSGFQTSPSATRAFTPPGFVPPVPPTAAVTPPAQPSAPVEVPVRPAETLPSSNAEIVWDDAGRKWAQLTDAEQTFLLEHHVDTTLRAEFSRQIAALPSPGGTTLTRLADDASDGIKAIRKQQEELNSLITSHARTGQMIETADQVGSINFPGRTVVSAGPDGIPPPMLVADRLQLLIREADRLAPRIDEIEQGVSRLGKSVISEAKQRSTTGSGAEINSFNRGFFKNGDFIGTNETYGVVAEEYLGSLNAIEKAIDRAGIDAWGGKRRFDTTRYDDKIRRLKGNAKLEAADSYAEGWGAMWLDASSEATRTGRLLWDDFLPGQAAPSFRIGRDALASVVAESTEAAMTLVGQGVKTLDEAAEFLDRLQIALRDRILTRRKSILGDSTDVLVSIGDDKIRAETAEALVRFWGDEGVVTEFVDAQIVNGRSQAVTKGLREVIDPDVAAPSDSALGGWQQAFGSGDADLRIDVQAVLHEIRGFGDEAFNVGDDVFLSTHKSMSGESAIAPHAEQLNRVVAEWMPDDWVVRSNARGQIGFYRKSKRAHYADAGELRTKSGLPVPSTTASGPGDGLLNVGTSGQLADSTMLHEVTHRAQKATRLHGELEEAWVARRIKPPPGLENDPRYQSRRLLDIIPGSNYKPREVAIEDDFFSPYIGKSYGGQHHESSAMAIERIAGLTPKAGRTRGYGNLLEDEDMAEWFIGMLGGT